MLGVEPSFLLRWWESSLTLPPKRPIDRQTRQDKTDRHTGEEDTYTAEATSVETCENTCENTADRVRHYFFIIIFLCLQLQLLSRCPLRLHI